MRNFESEDPNFGWMSSVTPAEARLSWKHLTGWLKKDDNITSFKGGILGEWVFQDSHNFLPVEDEPKFIPSEIPNAVQENWITPCEFPFGLTTTSGKPIILYAANLNVREVFLREINILVL